jgi:uncharacterized protein YbaP (TraB family)
MPRWFPLSLAGLLFAVSLGVRADALPLWEVAGRDNRLFILGSIHFLQPGRDALPPAILAAYRAADVVVMELDLDDLDPAVAQAAVQRYGIDPQGRSLAELMGSSDYRAARDQAQALGIDLALLDGMEPWLAAITVTQLELAKLGYSADAGVEQQVLKLARAERKEVRGLETVDEQFAALDSLPLPAQREFLVATLAEAASMDDEVDGMIAAWQAGDVGTMEDQFLASVREQPDLYRRIVVDRNRAWARELAALLDERRDYLVVVGTLHLVGPDSLIRLLDQAGHRARQLEAAPR